jgi:hypothetical protein
MFLFRSWLENKGVLHVVTLVDQSTFGTVAWQFALYFVLFDAYYYFLHRYIFHSKVRHSTRSEVRGSAHFQIRSRAACRHFGGSTDHTTKA